MRVRLTRKLAEYIDGVDLSRWCVGEIVDLPPEEVSLLLAEQWAEAAEPQQTLAAEISPSNHREHEVVGSAPLTIHITLRAEEPGTG